MIGRLILNFFKWLSVLLLLLGISAGLAGYYIYSQITQELPDIGTLNEVHYQIPLRIFSRDGYLISEFGEKKRIPVTIENVPKTVINAFLAAEDDRFFEHPGVDYKGILRAVWVLVSTGKKRQGGSTITMQVTRNFLLSAEKTYKRKLKEILLALKIEQTYSKNKILELYLNKIYLGHRSYGIAAAAQTYYGKNLSELTLAQTAMIAGLPKAPSAYNPITNLSRAMIRRNYILKRMLELGYINEADCETAINEPASAKLETTTVDLPTPYFAEMVRQKIIEQYGEETYNSGMNVFTTINRPLQLAATRALRGSLHNYDERHGYRTPAANDFTNMLPIGDTVPALVETITHNTATARLIDGRTIELPWDSVKWARKQISRTALGTHPRRISDVLSVKQSIRVRQLPNQTWRLAQIPEAEGAFVAINPQDGAILALAGGYDFNNSEFNRVIQSIRQPGSGFKPIIYTTALENGYTVASMINDAPIVIESLGQQKEWRPENYSRRFYGPTSLRTALRKSRNLISIRILQDMGIDKAVATAKRFGFAEHQIPRGLSLALGSGQATPLQMTRMYSVFANGGFLIDPYFIDRIEANDGSVLFQAQPKIPCPKCDPSETSESVAPRIISPQVDFLMNSLLRDVVQRGTATLAKSLNRRDLAGKTGTTNNQRDAWFNGYTSTISATAWVGFDNSDPLGNRETGGHAALPMWIKFMQEALKETPEQELIPPPGITKLFIDPNTGMQTAAYNQNGIWEYFDENQQLPQYPVMTDPDPLPIREFEIEPPAVEGLF